MKLDRKFAYEIKKEANGDGSRDARLARSIQDDV